MEPGLQYNEHSSSHLEIVELRSNASDKFSMGDAVAQAFQLFQAHPRIFIVLGSISFVASIAKYYSHSLAHITVAPIFNVLFLTGSLVIIRDLDTHGTTNFKRFFVDLYQLILALTVWVIIWILISIIPISLLLFNYIPYYYALQEGADVSPTFLFHDLKSLLITGVILVNYFLFMGIVPYIGLTIQLFNPMLSITKNIKYSLSLPFYQPKAILKFSILSVLMFMTGMALLVGFYVVHVVFIAFIYFVYKQVIQSSANHA